MLQMSVVQTIAHYLPFPIPRMRYFIHSGIELLGYPGRVANIDSSNFVALAVRYAFSIEW